MKIPETVVLSEISPEKGICPDKTIAVHLHIFYPDLAEEFARYLGNIPAPFDLYISIPRRLKCDESKISGCFKQLTQMQSIQMERTRNRGRDIAPMLCTFGRQIMEHDILLHLHTKKSPHDDKFKGWRLFITEHLLSSTENIERILNILQTTDIGIVSPPDYITYVKKGGWKNSKNIRQAQRILDRIGVSMDIKKDCPDVYFPQGSMFWARTECLAPLFNLGLEFEDFPKEPISTDGTLAHGIERLFFILAEQRGFSNAYVYNNPWQEDLIKYLNVIGKKNNKHLRLFQRLIFIIVALLLIILGLTLYIFR